MNKLEIQGSGFPGTNQTWRFVRDMINQVHNLAALGGDNYILSGCVNDGADNISDGYIVYNGELLPFTGGTLGAEVTIIETIENATYLEDLNVDGIGDEKEAYFTRVAQFGNTGAVTFNWDELKAITPLKQQSTPVGGIIMWSGAINAIPEGWNLCDGSAGTPNLSGRFIVGYDATDTDYDAIGKTGGAKEVVLTESQMPVHNHDGSTNSAGAHSHSYNTGSRLTNGWSGDNTTEDLGPQPENTNTAGSHTHSLTTNNKGGGAAHENRPQFFTLAYIIFVGV